MKGIPDWIYVSGFSFVLIGIMFMIQGHVGINLADEGFLWYGAAHTSIGEVPLLDFQSYDPGRYYWAALWFKIFGNTDIITLRIAALLFLWIGLTCALLAVRRVTKSWGYLFVIGTLLMVWVYPRHKMFDISISMIAVSIIILLLDKPKPVRYVWSGMAVGLAAFFGINHGLYSAVSVALASLYIFFKIDRTNPIKKMGGVAIGILIGYSPMLLMFAFVPGFLKRYVEMIIWLFRLGNTNIPLPIPWPWRVDFGQLQAMDIVSGLIVGFLFLLVLLFPAAGIIHSFASKKTNLYLAASAFAGLPYAYVAYSRADLGHLAQGIYPLLLGACFWALQYFKLSRVRITLCMTAMLAVSFLSVGKVQPLYQLIQAPPNAFVKFTLTNNDLSIDAYSANFIRTVQDIKAQYLKGDETLFIAPHTPTLYPILDLKSPLRDIYLLFPETEERQREQIEELNQKNAALVILGDNALDGRDELRFRNTHPILWEYLNNDYEAIAVEALPPNYTVLRRVDTATR
ncbi:hypothetical protein K0T92_12370 [Paenibacillus oenotherae]|uniref:Glycosyltransferase RgtA/B/C/D-like domain-containing protein n=1 Tax=Paenibacillus oenotherae TaxID=1435645 RepID=A0ABS7D6I5_9BACL|nr:hypothetical protein [Paenibacillus oenotherae]MBW7475547.1 hypothetical protein [Paenibacillus oenotherae]